LTDWLPELPNDQPIYEAIVSALESDIRAGALASGLRLPPQRALAKRLGVSVATVSKAYAEAKRRGLVSGTVGRGTFVRGRLANFTETAERPQQIITLNHNVPCATGDDVFIAETLSEILRAGFDDLLGYLPHQGRRDHREIVAEWLRMHGTAIDPEKIFICNGAQHGIALAAAILAKPGDTILAECATYSGITALAAHGGFRLRGVGLDNEGLIPEALDAALTETSSRVLYATPTLQTPTGAVLSQRRRSEIAEILSRHSAYLIEDDVFNFLCPDAAQPLSALIPEQTFYVTSFAKAVAPGLRVGAIVAPSEFRDRLVNGLRATGWMATPLMVELATRLVQNGSFETLVQRKRQEAQLRHAIAREALAPFLPNRPIHPAFHIWVPLPAGRSATVVTAEAAIRGVHISAPNVLPSPDPLPEGIRLCLGSPASIEQMRYGVNIIARIFEEGARLVHI
jgi:DNA-binding transcriptional MocR family regulator